MASEAAAAINPHWEELDQRARRRELVRLVVTVGLSWVLLFGAYFLAPFDSHLSATLLLRLSISVVVVVVVFVVELRQVLHAKFPVLRAARALAVIIPLFLVLFAGLYLGLSKSSSGDFNEALDHVSALYFTITTFSSVGFGDITPHTGVSQMVVSVQMLLDLVIVATAARLLLHAARNTRDREARQPAGPAVRSDGAD